MDLLHYGLIGVVALVTIVAAGAFSKKLGVAAPLILIVIGVGFSFIPGAPVQVPHELILFGLLPPILYSAAINVPVIEFLRNFTSISALSVLLVLATTYVTGVIVGHAYQRRTSDATQQGAQGLGWRGGVILGWSGMRGVVTLAAAQSLPEGTPYRARLRRVSCQPSGCNPALGQPSP